MRAIFLLCTALVSVLGAKEFEQPKLCALLIYDTSTPDIKKASQHDVERINKLFRAVAREREFSYHVVAINRSKLTEKKLRSWLKSLHSKNTNALLYYAGQGESIEGKEWSQITIKGGKKLSMIKLKASVQKKKAKQSMILFDCYSKAIPEEMMGNHSEISKSTLAKAHFSPIFKKYKNHGRSIVMGTSGKNAQETFYTLKQKPHGGLFTTVFIAEILEKL